MGKWRKTSTRQQRHPRVATAVPVRISTVDPETDPDSGKLFFRSAEETTANLSRGGAYLRSWEPLEAGRRVIVAIDLPSGGELQLAARVVWTRREIRRTEAEDLDAPGYGLEFFGSSTSELDRLEQVLASAQSTSQPKSTQAEPSLRTPPSPGT